MDYLLCKNFMILLVWLYKYLYWNIIFSSTIMESNQLKNIQNIENSLSLLKLKIQHMAKIENHNENALHHIIERAVPIV